MSHTDRRRFVQIAGTAAAASMMVAPRISANQDECGEEEILVTGTSNSGNLQEALEAAIVQAFEQAPQQTDVLLDFEIKSITGQQGGIAGFNRIFVTLCARFS